MSKKKDLKIVQSAFDVLPEEVIATSIKEISEGIKRLRSGRLNDKALVFLIQKSSGVAGDTVRKVLNAAQSLERDWLTTPKE
jgi:hypothetical protein